MSSSGQKDSSVSLNEIISSDIFLSMRTLNLVDEIELRNLLLKEDYKKLRNDYKATRAIEILREKYSLSDLTILNILFHNREKRLKSLIPINRMTMNIEFRLQSYLSSPAFVNTWRGISKAAERNLVRNPAIAGTIE